MINNNVNGSSKEFDDLSGLPEISQHHMNRRRIFRAELTVSGYLRFDQKVALSGAKAYFLGYIIRPYFDNKPEKQSSAIGDTWKKIAATFRLMPSFLVG